MDVTCPGPNAGLSQQQAVHRAGPLHADLPSPHTPNKNAPVRGSGGPGPAGGAPPRGGEAAVVLRRPAGGDRPGDGRGTEVPAGGHA